MKHTELTPALYDYLLETSLREHPALTALREETAKHPLAVMQIPPEQAQFMQFLLRLIQAEHVLELGTFTGYSTLAMALALPDHGSVITCDRNPEWTDQAHPFWKMAEQTHKIDLRLAPALTSMHALIEEGKTEFFDFIFIDADKTNYLQYYELSLQLVRPNGLIVIDNIFWDGQVIDPQYTRGQVRTIRTLNARIKNDKRVHISLLPISDGLFLIQKKAS